MPDDSIPRAFCVRWEIDIFDALDAEDAARHALAIQRDPYSRATCFQVQTPTGWVVIDLPDEEDPV
jgi:hypothetical protein